MYIRKCPIISTVQPQQLLYHPVAPPLFARSLKKAFSSILRKMEDGGALKTPKGHGGEGGVR